MFNLLPKPEPQPISHDALTDEEISARLRTLGVTDAQQERYAALELKTEDIECSVRWIRVVAKYPLLTVFLAEKNSCDAVQTARLEAAREQIALSQGAAGAPDLVTYGLALEVFWDALGDLDFLEHLLPSEDAIAILRNTWFAKQFAPRPGLPSTSEVRLDK